MLCWALEACIWHAHAFTKCMTREAALRQKLLILYLQNSALDSRVVGWTRYDGDSATPPVSGDEDEPPYETGLDALRDGWRAIQFSALEPRPGELSYQPGWQSFEVIMEKLVETPR